jgi:ribosome biogenesis GTPase
VLAAIERGDIEEARLEHAHKLEREAAYQRARVDVRARLSDKRKYKALSRAVREGQRRKGEP